MATPDAVRPPPTTAAIAIATAIIAGLLGYLIGQGSSLGLFGRSSSSAGSGAPGSDDGSSDEEEGEVQTELRGFEANKAEECKLVLVVRTDLGMTKGRLYCRNTASSNFAADVDRQDRGSMLSCYARLLQNPRRINYRGQDPPTLGSTRASQGCSADQERGRASHVAGPGAQLRSVCAGCGRRWEDPDSRRQHHGLGSGASAQEHY